jgi:hypothetical protein
MSVDQTLREMIRNEVGAQLRPITRAVTQLEGLRSLADRLGLSSLFGGAPAARRGPGRPPGSGAKGRRRGRPRKVGMTAGDRGCAIVGCKNKSRTKGYCAAHYQKLRMLIRTNRRPAAWADHAAANSVPDVVLPRGRAASKALKAARARARARRKK